MGEDGVREPAAVLDAVAEADAVEHPDPAEPPRGREVERLTRDHEQAAEQDRLVARAHDRPASSVNHAHQLMKTAACTSEGWNARSSAVPDRADP
jgi:hypothetical protein